MATVFSKYLINSVPLGGNNTFSFFFMEIGIFLKDRGYGIRINPIIRGNITEGFAIYTAVNHFLL